MFKNMLLDSMPEISIEGPRWDSQLSDTSHPARGLLQGIESTLGKRKLCVAIRVQELRLLLPEFLREEKNLESARSRSGTSKNQKLTGALSLNVFVKTSCPALISLS